MANRVIAHVIGEQVDSNGWQRRTARRTLEAILPAFRNDSGRTGMAGFTFSGPKEAADVEGSGLYRLPEQL